MTCAERSECSLRGTTICMVALIVALIFATPPSAADDTRTSPNRYRLMARETLEQLVEINTTNSVGNTTEAAEAMAERLVTAGFPKEDIQVLGPDPRKSNLVARYRGTGARPPLLLLAHLDVVEAEREDWSFDPFVFLEEDGYFYGRGSADDKAMAAIWVVNFIRMRDEGFVPDRDLILALTADEEGGDHNGVLWLLEHHRPLIDAAYCLNEGGEGAIRDGRYLSNEVQLSEKTYMTLELEVTNSGGHSSMPEKDNAIYHLAGGLARLAEYDFPVRLDDITRAYFERSAGIEGGPIGAAMNGVISRPPDPEVLHSVGTITEAMWPGIPVIPTMMTGATDGLYLRAADIPTYGVNGIFTDKDDDRAHGRDERIGVKQFFEGEEFLYRLVTALSSPPAQEGHDQ